jgi:hypothetical protein
MLDQKLRLVAPRAEPEDVANIEHERDLGCAEFLVWAVFFEVMLMIVGMLYCLLQLWPGRSAHQ